MRVSIVIAILDSHEIVRRQILHFSKMNLPDDVEIIFVDDGSIPPLTSENGLKNFRIHQTNDFRPWTQPTARNIGARLARGEYLICTDIDHILSRSLIESVRSFTGDVLRFKREVAVLDVNGEMTQDHGSLISYGFPEDRIKRRGLRISPHSNSYAIKRNLFLSLGGSRQKASYPNRDEIPLKGKLRLGGPEIIDDDRRPVIYLIPNGRFCGSRDYNPFGLFHNLKR